LNVSRHAEIFAGSCVGRFGFCNAEQSGTRTGPALGNTLFLPEIEIAMSADVFGYIAKASHDSGRPHVEPSVATPAFVPIAGFAIRWTVRSIPKNHIAGKTR
jgi:hypothetical protein